MGANETSWTAVFIVASHQTLLWVICDISREDGKDVTNKSISADHVNTIPPCGFKGLKKGAHAVVEDLITSILPLRLRETLQLGYWNVSYKNCGSGGWFAACRLLDIPNG
jgi:hypothetical protein